MPSQSPRRDGFAGQHMIVLPQPLRQHARQHPLLRGLHVTDAGYFPFAENHLVERPRGVATTLIILCLRGEGWFEIEGRKRTVHAGDFVWFPAGMAHAYGASEGSPWTIVWAHFAGEEAAGWLEFLQSSAGVKDLLLPIAPDHVGEVALDRVYSALERGLSTRFQIAAAAAFRTALSKHADIMVERHGLLTARERVAASVEAMGKEWSRTFRLEELATAAGMSVTHYCAHFRKLTGFAPIDFLIRLRVQHACRMLDTTRMSVGEIAAAVGYFDPYYFTRCFRRVMGCSPQAYRKIPKG
ncbi:MAG TPA: AraC family transcriptional regulator [Opitutaceae bacterium]